MGRYFLSILAIILFTDAAFAHRLMVNVQVRETERKVAVEVFFQDDTRPEKAAIQVFDFEKREIASGIADDQGLWSFPQPEPGAYDVIAKDNTGHSAKAKLQIFAPGEKREPQPPAPSKQEMTEYPLLNVLKGLGVLGLLVAGYFVLRAGCGWSQRREN